MENDEIKMAISEAENVVQDYIPKLYCLLSVPDKH